MSPPTALHHEGGWQGFSYSPPSEGDMLGTVLKMADRRMFISGLRSSPKDGPVFNWLYQKHKMRTGGYDNSSTLSFFFPAKTYDTIIFINSITQTELSPVSPERFSEWN